MGGGVAASVRPRVPGASLRALVAFLALALSGPSASAQVRSRSIRSVDFLNFVYRPSSCARGYGVYGVGASVRVRDGEYRSARRGAGAYFRVVGRKVVYGDLTGDGREEAVVQAMCGLGAGGAGLSEIFVYTLREGKPALLARLGDEDTDRDYHRHYVRDPGTLDGFLWGVVDGGVAVKDGLLTVERFVDGGQCCPKSIASLSYRWGGGRLVLAGRPQKRASAE